MSVVALCVSRAFPRGRGDVGSELVFDQLNAAVTLRMPDPGVQLLTE
jgi:hypothetical protein